MTPSLLKLAPFTVLPDFLLKYVEGFLGLYTVKMISAVVRKNSGYMDEDSTRKAKSPRPETLQITTPAFKEKVATGVGNGHTVLKLRERNWSTKSLESFPEFSPLTVRLCSVHDGLHLPALRSC